MKGFSCVRCFLASFPAIEFMKWLEITLSSVKVSLSMFKIMFCIDFLFVTLTIDLIPFHISESFLLC